MKNIYKIIVSALLASVLPLSAYAQALCGCSKLKSIKLPSTLTSIGDNAFRVCTRITEVSCEAPVPPTCSSTAFSSRTTGSYGAAVLQVSPSSASAYKIAPVLCSFAQINQEITAMAATGKAAFTATNGVFLLSPDCISSKVNYSVSFHGNHGSTVRLIGLNKGDTVTLTGEQGVVSATASLVGNDYQLSFAELASGIYMLGYGNQSMKLTIHVYNY